MGEREIKELLERELKECGYMYSLGILRGMFAAGGINNVEWATLTMWLEDMNNLAISQKEV